MEKLSITLDNLIDTQRKSIQQIERMNTKFSELSNSIKNYNESIVTEKKLDELLKKLNSLDQIERKVIDLENKVKDVKAINLQLQQIIEVTKQLSIQIEQQNQNVASLEKVQRDLLESSNKNNEDITNIETSKD